MALDPNNPNELGLSTHEVHDNDMADATPRRKMFSSTPVSDDQYTDDNRATSMAGIRSLAKAAKVGPGLKKVVPNTPR